MGRNPPKQVALDADTVRALRVHVLRMDALAQGLGAGVMAALVVFVATVWLVLKGGDVVGPNLALLAQFCPGYRVTLLGAIVGATWSFLYAGCAGYLLGRVYNRLAR